MNSSTEKALSVLRAGPYLAQEMDSIVEYWIGPARYSAAGVDMRDSLEGDLVDALSRSELREVCWEAIAATLQNKR